MSELPKSETIIIATIGPSSGEKETLKKMMESGMDMARLNMSWGTYEKHTEYINNIREAANEVKKVVPISMDLSGPRVKEEVGHHVDNDSIIVITEKDKADAEFGSKMKVDYFAMSYVTKAQDILDLKEIIKSHGSNAKIIAKIERREAVAVFESIAKVSDMIMIARGDLGNEYPLGEIPFIEKGLLMKSKELEVPVIVATQMLLSTTYQEIPSRAEVTDEVFAIINGADAIMLSEETANGKFPIEAISSMEEIASRTENYHKEGYEV